MRTFTQIEYLRMPKTQYEQIKDILTKMANTANIEMSVLLDFVSEDNGKISNRVIDTIYRHLCGVPEVSEDDAKRILIEKKRLLHIIHIIRYELSG
jgi:hypothetical protein